MRGSEVKGDDVTMEVEVGRMDFKEKGRGDGVWGHRRSLPRKNHEQRHSLIDSRRHVSLGLIVP